MSEGIHEQAYVERELEHFKHAFPDADLQAIKVIRMMLLEAYREGFKRGQGRPFKFGGES
jgi:hypothetical protein